MKIDLIKQLKPFFEKRNKLYLNFLKREVVLQTKMNEKLRLGINLEFFYCDGVCVGIGAENYSDRKTFPLIHDSDLE